jgi:hypothetical protein
MKSIYFLIVLSFAFCSLSAQDQIVRLKNLGPQIRASVIQGSIFLEDKNGRELVYTVVRGNPAHLLGFTVNEQELILDQELPATDGAWDMTISTDGFLYIPGAKGRLYRHFPGTDNVEDLGFALAGQTTIWNLASGENGEIFGATYPGCRVFRYHPKDGFSDVGGGPLVESENYVRSLAFHEKSGKLYAGVGSHADLIELDPKKGSKRSILPPEFKNKEFVYSLEIVEGETDNDKMLAQITNGSFTLVYDLKHERFEYQIDDMDMKAVSRADLNNRMYYTFNSELFSRDLSNPQQAPIKLADQVGSANAIKYKNKKIYLLNSDAMLLTIDLATGMVIKRQLKVPGQPISLQSIMKGPDGRIWSGGYLAGGHAAFDPKTGQISAYTGLHQTEGMAIQGKAIYFGIYPKGQFYQYDTSYNWDVKSSNPKFIGQIADQSRPFAVLSDFKSGKIFFGMVPEYGKLGGALISYNPNNSELKSLGAIIPDQSIVSLTYANGLVWGGTSVSGGLGIMPTTKFPKLFSWDVEQEKIIDEIIPVNGANAITSLIVGPDGNIWGMAGGTLFVFNPQTKQLVKQKEIYPTPPLTSHVWRDAFLIAHPSGMIYGTGSNQLFSIDPKTMQVDFILKPASLLAMDDEGKLYFHRSAELWQYEP